MFTKCSSSDIPTTYDPDENNDQNNFNFGLIISRTFNQNYSTSGIKSWSPKKM